MPKTTYVWDELSDNVIEEYEGGVLTASYSHEPGLYGKLLRQNRSGTTHYYHFDGCGDTVALTDDAGNVTDTKDYDAWGNVVATSGSTVMPYQFLGNTGGRTESIEAILYARTCALETLTSRWTSLGSSRLAGGVYQFQPEVPPIEPQDKKGEFTVDFGPTNENNLPCCSVGILVKYAPSPQDRHKFQRIDLRAYVRTHVAMSWPCRDHHNGRPPGVFGPDDWTNTLGGYSAWVGSIIIPAMYDDFPGYNVSRNPETSNGACPRFCRFDGISQDFELCAVGLTKGFGISDRVILGCVTYGWKCEMKYRERYLGFLFGPCYSCRKSCNITEYGEGTFEAGAPSNVVDASILEGPFPSVDNKGRPRTDL